jgi:diguanylate cyclase (GGDEF)-like protein/PAS domain S-box-containing protein
MVDVGTLQRAGYLYIAALAAVALGGTAVAVAAVSPPGLHGLILAVALAAGMATAYLFPLHLAFKTKLHLTTMVIAAAILLLPPGCAAVVAGAGSLLAHRLRRYSWRQTVFNTAQSMLQPLIGGGLLALAGWDPAAPDYAAPTALAMYAVAGAAMFLVNTLAVAAIVGLQSRQAPLRVWWRNRRGSDRSIYLAHIAQLALGLLAGLLATELPLALVLLVPLACALQSALRHQQAQEQQTRAALDRAEANLTEAQQLARLGSWEWDLRSGRLLWSDEVFRILGLEPGREEPSHVTLIAAVHPDDRAELDRAIHAAVATRRPFGRDHRLLGPGGGERIVHHQGKVILAPDGQPLRLLGTIHDITARKELEAQLAHQAFHDPLTGLANRARFIERLERALAAGDGERPTVAVLFLDRDRFKQNNDSFGHAAGDRLLVTIAERLRAWARPGDLAARLGGDEFTILLAAVADTREVARLAQRLTEALRVPVRLHDQEIVVTASVGAILGVPGHHTAATLLREADSAMYRAKRHGKARYELGDPDGSNPAPAQLQLEQELRQAVERGEFVVHYQPQIELGSGRIVGLEALARWRHPERGLLAPAAFLPLAETTGLIHPLGRAILAEACRQGARWHRQRPETMPLIGVNLSPAQFQHPELVEEVAEALRETGLPPELLCLEIGEGAVMGEMSQVLETLRALKGLGVRLAIDDFGIGYSSLACLKHFPVDGLKIDGNFTLGLGCDRRDEAIVAAVIALGRALELRVTAERIENETQLAQLRALGCPVGQGEFFARPQEAEAIGAMLVNGVGAGMVGV